ncbi:Cell cycle regulated microtubule associated protein [Musa troglodytarum]|uniref:Cell cycle regulated microtubule associated protein n=1 Tax=Musa troglodytarum TaxID=320322 RepID=A0A9E7G9G7_9LILI|nr:Cell cycle regulated microtubule associated protein [Musa troglodytarum]
MASGDVGGGSVEVLLMDEAYEFSAPRFYDFINGETEEYIKRAELWFETSLSYAPSPFVPRIREGRSIQIDSLCDFGNVEKEQKVEVSSKDSHQMDPAPEVDNTERIYQHKLATDMEVKAKKDTEIEVSEVECCQTNIVPQQETSLPYNSSTSMAITGTLSYKEVPLELPIALSGGAPATASAAFTYIAQASSTKAIPPSIANNNEIVEVCTPRAQRSPVKGVAPSSSKTLAAKRIANLIRQPSTLKQKSKSPTQSLKSTKRKNVIKCTSNIAAKNSMGNDIAQENQAVKRQKLHDGRFRQIHNVKNGVLYHKSRLGFTGGTDMLTNVEKSLRKSDTASVVHRRSKLTLTRPKDPELETAHRVRAVQIKSSAELEEEMLAKIPKFKARPLNKKILEAPTFPALPRSIPQPPVFQEFRLKTMERANQHAETSSAVSSLDGVVQNQVKPLRLTEPRPPHLETSFRARPPKNKSSQESELEELEKKIPKFKARPLNKKILESKREIGMFCNPKPQKTIPQEFHFSTEDRLGPPATVVEIFDKLSLHSESSNHEKKEVNRITIPNPFHLHTEERGLEKENQLAEQLLQKELEEERARIPKATPYPYAIDYPVIPPKPESKQCKKPEAFQLESLVRHEEEMLRKLEEKERTEREEAQQRIFRAQAIKKFDHIPLPERERKPLTEVQKFVLHVDHRSVRRTEFDRKIKEKELRCKRLREEQESAKMIEEEKAVKQMRRTMVPHARPLPKFNNPFIPPKSMKQGTKPKSPDLHSQWTVVIGVNSNAHMGEADRNAEAMSGCSRAQYTLASGLGALAQAGDHCGLLSLFLHSCRVQPVKPDRPIYLALLKAAAAVSSRSMALSLHAHIAKSGYQRDVAVATALVDAFSRCYDSASARRLFDEMQERDAVAWNAMLSGCARNGDAQQALSMAYEMASSGVRPNTVTLSVLLQVCGRVEDKRLGQSVHAYAVRHLQLVDTFLGNSLIVYYNRAGESHISERIFARMLRRDIVSWNAMITGQAQCGFGWRALELFNLMREEHHPDLFSIETVLQVCAQIGEDAIDDGQATHGLLVKLGFQMDVYEQNSLLLFYCKCGMMESAQSIFDKMEARNIVSWNILVNEALEHLRSMHVNACSLDAVTIVNMLSVCSGTLNLRSGKVIHGFMLRNKHDYNVFAITALLEHYAKCGAVNEACYLFLKIPVRNRVTWNTMVHCCVHNGFPRASVKLFYLMQEQDGFMPDATSVVGVIKAIAQRGYEEEKNYIHKFVTERGFTDDEFVANSLIAMHARFHDFDKAISVFERTSKLSTVTWNTMISVYSNYDLANKAMSVYHLMKLQNVAPDLIHTVICKSGYESDMFVGTSLVCGYAKCGDLSMARLIFDGLESKSTVSWNSMIQGYGVHGNAEAVHELFSEMQQSGTVPTVVTFLNIISACSHVGDVEKGKHYYDLMTRVHSVIPNRELLSSLADLLGRSGRLREVHEALEKGPLDPGLDAWGALLGACRIQGNLEIGLIAANNVLELDPIHRGYNLLLSNMHAEAGRWILASKIRKRVNKTGLKKASGWSKVEGLPSGPCHPQENIINISAIWGRVVDDGQAIHVHLEFYTFGELFPLLFSNPSLQPPPNSLG